MWRTSIEGRVQTKLILMSMDYIIVIILPTLFQEVLYDIYMYNQAVFCTDHPWREVLRIRGS